MRKVKIVSGLHVGKIGEVVNIITLPQGQGKIYCIHLGESQVVPCQRSEIKEVN